MLTVQAIALTIAAVILISVNLDKVRNFDVKLTQTVFIRPIVNANGLGVDNRLTEYPLSKSNGFYSIDSML